MRSWPLPTERRVNGRLRQERRAGVRSVRGENGTRRSAFGMVLREHLLRVRVRGAAHACGPARSFRGGRAVRDAGRRASPLAHLRPHARTKGGGRPDQIAYTHVVHRPRARESSMGNRRNVNKMMQQVQQMQQQMQQAQEELANETVTASAGGGAVRATMTGGMELVSIEIDPEDVEMLQDMVLAAVNEAMTSSQELANKKLSGITGGLGDLGLNIPGL